MTVVMSLGLFQLSLSCVDSGGRSWGVVWVVGVRSWWRVGSPRWGVRTRPRRTPWTRGRVPIAHVGPTKSSCTTSRSSWRSSAWHLALIWVVVMVLGGRMLLVRVVRWPIFTHWVPVWPANSASVSLLFCFILLQDNATWHTEEDIVRRRNHWSNRNDSLYDKFKSYWMWNLKSNFYLGIPSGL